jgi:long-chain acyl-CoA synthetase
MWPGERAVESVLRRWERKRRKEGKMEHKEIYEKKPWLRFYPKGVPETLPIPEKTIPELFDEVTRKYGNRVALVFYGRKLTFKELEEQVNRFAHALWDLGVRKGDRVALYLLNSPQYIISYFGALKAGATVTPISPVYTSIEVKYQLEDSEARYLVCQDILYENVEKAKPNLKEVIVTNIGEYLPPLKKFLGKSLIGKIWRKVDIPTPKIEESSGIHQFQNLIKKYPPKAPEIRLSPKEDLAALPYTGGTTGSPKGAMLTHFNLIACSTQTQSFWPFLEEGKETMLAFLPFYHIYGQVVVMLNGLIQGSTLLLFTTPDLEEILEAIETYKASMFFGVPTMYEYLKEYDKTDRVNWKRLKGIVCGADTLHESTVKDWERKTGTRILEGYGLTECSAVSHTNPFDRPKVGSFGVPLPNISAAILGVEKEEFMPVGEIGELILHGPNIMQGYWKKPEETKNQLIEIEGKVWLRTGDLVKMDEEGYFHFYDRKKDLIKYKGYSVFAKEIEEVLYSHPKVKAAGVIGVPDPKVGQIIKAIVVLQTEARGKISEEEIIQYCEGKLAHYKVPKIVEFRGELPKTDVGKISRRELREETEGV